MDNFIGSKFGRLTVIEKFDDGKKYSYKYVCECSCEKKTRKVYEKSYLKNGNVLDCGCLKLEMELAEYTSHIGEKYNQITIIEFIGKRTDIVSNANFYKCACDCNSDKEVLSTLYDLQKGRQKSCGMCFSLSDEQRKKISESKKKKNEFINHGEYIEGFTDDGCSFLFDVDDFDSIKNVGKYITMPHGYALFSDRKEGDFQLHRFIMGLGRFNHEDGIIVDHINGDKSDCRKSNLRVCHKNKNPKNAQTYSNNTSGHKGITWMSRLNKWQVSIQVDKDNKYLGIYSDFNKAVEVRKQAEIEYFGEYSRDYREDALKEDSDDL